MFVFDAFLRINHNATTFPPVLVIFRLATAQKGMHRAAADANPGHTRCSTNANSLLTSLQAEELHQLLQQEALASSRESSAGSLGVSSVSFIYLTFAGRRMFQHVSACFTPEGTRNDGSYTMLVWYVCIKNERIRARPCQVGSCGMG